MTTAARLYLVVVVIIEFRDGKIFRETRYYPQPFEAPEWRAQWMERMGDSELREPAPPS